jgi:hypothetical protein
VPWDISKYKFLLILRGVEKILMVTIVVFEDDGNEDYTWRGAMDVLAICSYRAGPQGPGDCPVM